MRSSRTPLILSLLPFALALAAGCSGRASDAKSEHDGVVSECALKSTKLANAEVTKTTNEKGQVALHAGQPFVNAPEVAVADLLRAPEQYEGKVVRVAGDIAAMCEHSRGWFAIVPADKSGAQLQIMTAPVFLVPASSVGKSAIAEGTVDVVKMTSEHAIHLADEHKLDKPAAGADKVTRVVLRANAAEFL